MTTPRRTVSIADHIAVGLRAKIDRQEQGYAPGDKMPRIEDIAADERTTQTTVRSAYRQLEEEGLIEKAGSGRAAGWRVALPPTPIDYPATTAGVDDWQAAVLATGKAPTSRTEVVIPGRSDVPAAVRTRLGLDPAEGVLLRRTIRTVDNAPSGIELTYIPAARANGTPLGLPDPVDLATEFNRLRTPVTHATEEVTARKASYDEGAMLRLHALEPVQEVTRTLCAGDTPLAVTVLVAPGSAHRRVYRLDT